MRTEAEVDRLLRIMLEQRSVTRARDFVDGVTDALLWVLAEDPAQVPMTMQAWDLVARSRTD